jgi:type I restriction enzyme S subunit
MDRSKWEYKKLGEVAKFVGGGTPSKAKEEYYTGNIPWATVRDMTDFCLNQTELCITEQAVKESATNIIPKDTIIISTHVGLGKICLLMQDTAINQDLKGVILPPSIDKMYFAAWYKSISDYIVSNGKGATVKGVTMKFVNDLNMPLPPIADQQRIVAELNCLNEMIAVKQEQLKEFDKLAQSIFYDMFGDPIENEKGWDVKKLGELCYIGLGFTHTPTYVDEGVPFLSVKDITGGEIDFSNAKFVSEKEFQDAPKGAKPQKGDVMFCRVGTMGKPVIINTDRKFCTFVSLGYLSILNNELNNVYLKYWMLSDSFNNQVTANVRGLAIKNLNTGWLKMFNIPVPPLSLQQQFADKISAIEAQKELVKQSIAETQSLFNSRMDYFFN